MATGRNFFGVSLHPSIFPSRPKFREKLSGFGGCAIVVCQIWSGLSQFTTAEGSNRPHQLRKWR